MKKLLVVGDSFFRNEPVKRKGQHFSDMFGDDITVVNAAMPGSTNTQIIAEALVHLNAEYYDYLILGFTVPSRLAIAGKSIDSPNTLVNWRSSAHIPNEKESKIIDNFMSMIGIDEMNSNSLLLMYAALNLFKDQFPKTNIAWSAGPVFPVLKNTKSGPPSNADYRILRALKKFYPSLLKLDLWGYSPLVNHDPIWHIDDVGYQRKVASEFKELLGITL